MVHRSPFSGSSSSGSLLSASALGILIVMGLATMGCESKARIDTRQPTVATPASNELAGAALTTEPRGEQRLDTNAPIAPTPANRIAVTNAPLSTSFRATKARKPGSDENLPKWVPLRGRLTVVEAPDLAENLGLVPKGTAKTAEARVSVADLMANAGTTTATSTDGAPRSATWLASNGRVRHARGR